MAFWKWLDRQQWQPRQVSRNAGMLLSFTCLIAVAIRTAQWGWLISRRDSRGNPIRRLMTNDRTSLQSITAARSSSDSCRSQSDWLVWKFCSVWSVQRRHIECRSLMYCSCGTGVLWELGMPFLPNEYQRWHRVARDCFAWIGNYAVLPGDVRLNQINGLHCGDVFHSVRWRWWHWAIHQHAQSLW